MPKRRLIYRGRFSIYTGTDVLSNYLACGTYRLHIRARPRSLPSFSSAPSHQQSHTDMSADLDKII